MSKEKSLLGGGMVYELFQPGLYKRSQGKVTRQVTFAAIAVGTGLAAWRMFEAKMTQGWFDGSEFLFPLLVLMSGLWIGFRVVNLPRFADFLIAVEAEMNKVSWPSRMELYRSALVVIFVIFVMAGILFGFDLFWKGLFKWLRIVY